MGPGRDKAHASCIGGPAAVKGPTAAVKAPTAALANLGGAKPGQRSRLVKGDPRPVYGRNRQNLGPGFRQSREREREREGVWVWGEAQPTHPPTP